MSTKVVNLRREKYDVYIGRPGKGRPGPWGNPIVLGQTCPECGEVHTRANPGQWEACYEAHLRRMLRDPVRLAAFVALRGKRLGCFCKPAPCHGDVMVRVLESIMAEVSGPIDVEYIEAAAMVDPEGDVSTWLENAACWRDSHRQEMGVPTNEE